LLNKWRRLTQKLRLMYNFNPLKPNDPYRGRTANL
jgi:hypothetical protein